MNKKMLINATHPEENRVAIVEDGILTELDIEIAGKEQTKGNIYKATVVRVETGLQAAFVDYGAERLGFLQMGDLHPSLFKVNEEKGRPRIADVLRRGQELLVQVVKEERGTKGAALTTFLSLPGRFMVLMPDSDTKGVSRKIEDDPQRKKLKAAMASLDLPEHMGYIVRTAGIGQTNEELKRDFDYLVRVWENLQTLSRQVKAPALVYRESNLVIRSIRDYFSSDMDEVLVDDPKVCQEAKDFFQQVMPEFARLVKLHQERRPIFSRYQIEEQIETIVKNKVPLPSGGSIVIDSTEALVAVDVNSGKMAGEQGVEGTAYKTNLEAAEEVGRQLRLRDLGGLIVIDFIDMRDRKHIREVEKRLKDALKNDKARVTIGKISQFGMLEMSRQRIKAALAEGSYLPCPHCQGTGRIKNVEAQTVAFLRKIQAGLAKGQIGRIEGEIPLEVATYLLNTKREELLEMERRHQVTIFVKGRPDFIAGQMELNFLKREKEETLAEYVEAAVTRPAAEPKPEAVTKPEIEGAEEEAAGGEEKKKRKRRRKKKEGGAELSAEAAEEAEEAESAVAATGEAADEIVGAEEMAAAEGEAASGEGAKKKRKRRRKKKKPETAGEAAGETVEASAAAAVAEESAIGESAELPPVSEAATAEEETHKKKRRRRRKKKPAATLPAEGGVPAVEPVEPIAASAPVPEPFPVVAEALPVPAKKAPARGRKAAVKAPAPETEAPAAEAVAEPAPAKKTPARGRKAAAKPPAPETEAPAAEAAAEPAPVKKAPIRSRKKASEAPGPETEASAVPVAAEPVPAKKRPARRKAAAKEESTENA